MINHKKVVVAMPAYKAASRLKKTYDEVMAQGNVDLVIIVVDDDVSKAPPHRLQPISRTLNAP